MGIHSKQTFYDWLKSTRNTVLTNEQFATAENQGKSDIKTGQELLEIIGQKNDYFQTKTGFNIYGYLGGNFGLANVGKDISSAFKIGKIAQSKNDLDNIFDSSFLSQTKNKHIANLYCCNADKIKCHLSQLDLREYLLKYQIGVWFWELEQLPEYFSESFKKMNEIWVFSQFCRDAMAMKSPIPVIEMPYPFFPLSENINPIKHDKYTFLAIFDYNSDFVRKNIMTTIKVFRAAFPNRENVKLILKTLSAKARPLAEKLVNETIAGDDSIELIDDCLSVADMTILWRSVDCYVSLHHSEGLGKNIMDAIWFEKPTICTGYSGNMTFQRQSDHGIVSYRMVSSRNGSFPEYHVSGGRWAEPDFYQAVDLMHQTEYGLLEKTRKAIKSRMLKQFSIEKFCQAAKMRLSLIDRDKILQRDIQAIFAPRKVNENIIKDKNNILLFYTTRKWKLKRIIENIMTINPDAKITIFGRSDQELKRLVGNYLLYPEKGFYLLEKIPWVILTELKQQYDIILIPFFNDNFTAYANIFEILRDIQTDNIYGINGINDIFDLKTQLI